MDWDTVRENWGAVLGVVKQRWPRLTPDDVDVVAGSRRYLIDVISERYRWSAEAAELEVDRMLPQMVSCALRSDLLPPTS